MKKYLATIAVIGLFVVLPVHAQTTNEQTQSLLQRTLDALRAQLSQLQAAAISATTMSATGVNPVSAQPTLNAVPADATAGCGQTLTPRGTINQTIRCNGNNWVAAGNLLNDGVDVGIGAETPRSAAKLLVVGQPNQSAGIVGYSTGSETVGVVGKTSDGTGVSGSSVEGMGVSGWSNASGLNNIMTRAVGVRGIANGYKGKGVFGTSDNPAGVGVEGMGQNGAGGVIGTSLAEQGSIAGTGVLGSGHIGVIGSGGDPGIVSTSSIGVKAISNNNGYGFYQEGANARNYFQGKVEIGTLDPSLNAMLNVKSSTSSVLAIQAAGGVRIATGDPMPTCTNELRGTLWFQNGGSQWDKLFVCAKDTSGANGWRILY